MVLDDLIWVCCKFFFWLVFGDFGRVCWDFAMFVLGLVSC